MKGSLRRRGLLLGAAGLRPVLDDRWPEAPAAGAESAGGHGRAAARGSDGSGDRSTWPRLELEDRPVVVVAPVGDRDAVSAERLKGEIAVLASAGYPIVVDLTDGTLDSQTLSVLLGGRRQAGRADFRFMLALSEGEVSRGRRILEILGLDSSFAIFASLREAVAGARGSSSPASHPGSGRSQRQGAGIT